MRLGKQGKCMYMKNNVIFVTSLKNSIWVAQTKNPSIFEILRFIFSGPHANEVHHQVLPSLPWPYRRTARQPRNA